MYYGDPANGTLGILPIGDNAPATIEDARWLADALAFDHDAPVGISPAWDGVWPNQTPRDPAAHPPIQPIHPFSKELTGFYWESLNQSYGAAAELRFQGSYVIRYDNEDATAPRTAFSDRFAGREEWVALYAMAARQADVLAEYLCLYRVLEAADNANGKSFTENNLSRLATHDFGDLRVIGDDMTYESSVNAFEAYRARAQAELARLRTGGVSDMPSHLYSIRNSLAHGKHNTLTTRHQDRWLEAGRALPVVKLLARLAIEPTR